MTIKECIEQLSACPDPENHRVCAIDPDTKRIVDVTAISAEDAFMDEPYVAIFSTFVPLRHTRSACPHCQGIPLRYKLVEDDSLVGAHRVGVMCRHCNGDGQV